MEKPLITVVIPVYNRESTILRALNSVLDQTYSNIEVVVVDDGSTDSTAQIVADCADERVRLICLSSNQGANRARNTGIREAKGEYIAFQDSDDEWLADKLEKQLAYIQETGAKAVYCPYILYDGEKTRIVPEYYMNRDICEKNVVETLKKYNVVGTPTLIIKKELFAEIGMFDVDMKRLQDYELVIRLVKSERLGYIPEPLVKAYRMEQGITSNVHLVLETCTKILEKHSGFFNIRTVLHTFLRYVDSLGNDRPDSSEFDKIVELIQKPESTETKEECYKIAMQYFCNQNWMKRSVLTEWYLTFRDNLKAKKFAVYGAGMWGQKAYYELKKDHYIPEYFLVTEQGGKTVIEGIPVETLANQKDLGMPVIIAVSWEKQNELIRNLINKGMYRFCIYPFG